MFHDPRNEKIVVLILKWLREEISAEESEELERWKDESPENRAFFDERITADGITGDLKVAMSMDELSMDDRLNRAIGAIEAKKAKRGQEKRRMQPLHRLAAAAVFGLLVISALFLIRRPAGDGSPGIVHTMLVSGDVAPGGNRAVLTTADGRQIILDSAAIGKLGTEGNTEVRKVNNERLSYEEEHAAGMPDSTGAHPGKRTDGHPQLYNTLTTPRAGEFQVRLPDGTNVWLNNASTLHYPTTFSGAQRQVELGGEAYFEVAPDGRRPFIVTVIDGVHVEVLGTSFNIMAYPDERSVKTSLLNGSVKVSAGGASVMLKPNQQARLETRGPETRRSGGAGPGGGGTGIAEPGVTGPDAAGSLKVEPVDTKLVIAWKDGFFNFSNSDVPAVMRQLARWYDVTVEYEGKVPENRYDGRISRDLSLSDVKKVLAESHVFFKIAGKKIIVSP